MSDIFDAPGIPHVGYEGVTLVDIKRLICVQHGRERTFYQHEHDALDRWIEKKRREVTA